MILIGDDLTTYRKHIKLSRESFAAATGLKPGAVWRIEAKSNPTEAERALLEAYFSSKGDIDLANLPAAPTKPATASKPVRKPAEPVPGRPEPRSVPVGPDWVKLRLQASQVGDHDYERVVVGPDPRTARLVSNSEVATFEECPRKWWLTYVRHMAVKMESPTGAAQIGSRIHKALSFWYTPDKNLRVDPRDALEFIIQQDWANIVAAHVNSPDELLMSIKKKFDAESELERAMIEGYMMWLEETGADADFEIVASERYVEHTLDIEPLDPSMPIKLIAKLDVQAIRTTNGKRLFIDHKSVGDFIKPRMMLPLNRQMKHYMLLEWMENGGEEYCDAALYNMLRKVKRTAQAKPPFYDRVEVIHNRHVIENYKNTLFGVISDMLNTEEALREGENPQVVAPARPNNDCTWKCTFFPVCPMFDDGSNVEGMLREHYRVADPLDYYKQFEVEEYKINGNSDRQSQAAEVQAQAGLHGDDPDRSAGSGFVDGEGAGQESGIVHLDD